MEWYTYVVERGKKLPRYSYLHSLRDGWAPVLSRHYLGANYTWRKRHIRIRAVTCICLADTAPINVQLHLYMYCIPAQKYLSNSDISLFFSWFLLIELISLWTFIGLSRKIPNRTKMFPWFIDSLWTFMGNWRMKNILPIGFMFTFDMYWEHLTVVGALGTCCCCFFTLCFSWIGFAAKWL